MQIIELLTKKPGDEIVLILVSRKPLGAKWWNTFKNGEIFLMNNKAIIECGFHRTWRILQIWESVISTLAFGLYG